MDKTWSLCTEKILARSNVHLINYGALVDSTFSTEFMLQSSLPPQTVHFRRAPPPSLHPTALPVCNLQPPRFSHLHVALPTRPKRCRFVRGVHGWNRGQRGSEAASVQALVPLRLHHAVARASWFVPALPASAHGGDDRGGGRRIWCWRRRRRFDIERDQEAAEGGHGEVVGADGGRQGRFLWTLNHIASRHGLIGSNGGCLMVRASVVVWRVVRSVLRFDGGEWRWWWWWWCGLVCKFGETEGDGGEECRWWHAGAVVHPSCF